MDEPQANQTVIEMIDVDVPSLHSPTLAVVEHVNWTVRQSEYWVVAGLPASGKSDFLATAAGLVRPRGGLHKLFGQDLVHLPDDERLRLQLRVGVVFGQGGRLFSHLTVAENLALPVCYHSNCPPGEANPRVQAVLEAMELSHVRASRPTAINRSLRQRVGLARALVLAPSLLFLDSPLAGIDPHEARWWLSFLRKLSEGHPLIKGHKATLIVATEDLQPWADQGCQFSLLQEGRFLVVGSRTDLLEKRAQVLPELQPVAWLNK
jgi:phospholipid/cholesterol/gamma-HCH transport system ATP-binding protein